MIDGAGGTSESVVSRLERLLLGSSVSNALHAELVSHHKQADGNAVQKLRSVLQLMLSLPEYQID